MLEEISVSADYCFGEKPLRLQDLGKVNFVFAPNGSGKTTISNALASQPRSAEERLKWPTAPTELPIRVFNESYRSQVLVERVNGIFTIGVESQQANDEIDAIAATKRQRAKDRETWRKEIGSDHDNEGFTGLLGVVAKEREIAKTTVFDAHRQLEKSVASVVFKGFRNDRDKFLSEALRRTKDKQSVPEGVTWESLDSRVSSLTGDNLEKELLPKPTIIRLLSDEMTADLAKSGKTSGAGDLAALIQELSNEDWVSDGRAYVHDSGGICPFCQQELQDDFEDKLAEYFASGFDALLNRANEISKSVEEKSVRLERELAALELVLRNNDEIETETFEREIKGIRNAVTVLRSKVGEKCSHPTRSIDVSDISGLMSALIDLVETRNEELSAHNRLISNAKEEGKAVVEDGWALFLHEPTVKNAIKRFFGISRKNNDKIATLRQSIVSSEEADQHAEREVARLRSSISNTAKVADRINELLKSMGFNRFSVTADDEVTGGYRIVRSDGSLAFESLSEGEKSFLCFAYFWESLFGSTESGQGPDDVVVVIDDPISSLDSDTLFIVAAHVRHAATLVVKGESHLRQLIVLTHNTQFHNEAAYHFNDQRKGDWHYFRLLRGGDGFTRVADDGDKNRIRGTYPLLWDSVVEAARNDEESALVQVGVFNIVRRIVEGYFKITGRVTGYKEPTELSPTDQRVISMFHMWASAGSHTIADDIEQTVDVGGTQHFLRLFRRYFDLVGHSAHFEMMLNGSHGADLAMPGGVFSPTSD